LLIDEGKLDLNKLASLAERDLSAYYSQVTYRHFTTMTSGYNAVGLSRWNEKSADWSFTPYTPDKPLFKPGQAYCYWDEAMMMFSRCLTIESGLSMKELMTKKITSHIGFGEWNWQEEKDYQGIPINNGCTGVKVSSLQLARFGHLMLNQGRWGNKQLISSSWVNEATRNQIADSVDLADTDRKSIDGRGKYGYNWWIFSKGKDAPVDAYYASGLFHNICLVIPEWNMVIVRTGHDGNPIEGKHLVYGEFMKLLQKGIRNL
jgi:CubicO group peptidase (beta-lactamase class C family)